MKKTAQKIDQDGELERSAGSGQYRPASRRKIDVLLATAGLWRLRHVDGVEWQRRVRAEWDERLSREKAVDSARTRKLAKTA